MLILKSPDETRGRLDVKRVELPGGRSLEVSTLDGVEYVRGSPPDLQIVMTRIGGMVVDLRRRDNVASANALCSIHRLYRAKRRPRTSCAQCHAAYDRLHEEA